MFDTRKYARNAKRVAIAAGYDIREGSYTGTTDDRLGHWYVTHESDDTFRPYGAGYATKTAAWNAAFEDYLLRTSLHMG